jgi:hypothetical protein
MIEMEALRHLINVRMNGKVEWKRDIGDWIPVTPELLLNEILPAFQRYFDHSKIYIIRSQNILHFERCDSHNFCPGPIEYSIKFTKDGNLVVSPCSYDINPF